MIKLQLRYNYVKLLTGLLLQQVRVHFTTTLLYQICSQLFCCLLHIGNVLLLEQVSVQFTIALLYRFEIPAQFCRRRIKPSKAKLFLISSAQVHLSSWQDKTCLHQQCAGSLELLIRQTFSIEQVYLSY